MSQPICLIVDDSRLVRKVARRILEQNGFEVEEARNGIEGLASCRRTLPRCILLDWNMPVLDGIGMLKALQAEFDPCPAVIFCTTENHPEQMLQATDHGAAGYIVKPFDKAILLGKFAQLGLM